MKSQIQKVFDEFSRNINIFFISLCLKEGYMIHPVGGDGNVAAGFGPTIKTEVLGKSVEINNFIKKVIKTCLV